MAQWSHSVDRRVHDERFDNFGFDNVSVRPAISYQVENAVDAMSAPRGAIVLSGRVPENASSLS